MSLNIFLNSTQDTQKHTFKIFMVRFSMLIAMLGRFMHPGSSSSSSYSDSYTCTKYEINDGSMNSIVFISQGFIFRQLYTENQLSFDIKESIESFLQLVQNYFTCDFLKTNSKNFSISCTSYVYCSWPSSTNCSHAAYLTFLKICEQRIN